MDDVIAAADRVGRLLAEAKALDPEAAAILRANLWELYDGEPVPSPWHALAQAQAAELARLREAVQEYVATFGEGSSFGGAFRDWANRFASALSASPARTSTER
jgi:thioesterase domain-containing protein